MTCPQTSVSCVQAAGKQLVNLMDTGANILGIDVQSSRAGFLTLEQTAWAATAAFKQALQVTHPLLTNL